MRRVKEEREEKKNGRSLGIGLASSLLLYKAAAKREWGHKARREEKKNRPISMQRTLELMPLCRYSPFFLSFRHNYTMMMMTTTSSSKKKENQAKAISTYTRLDRNGFRMMIGLLLLLLTSSSSIHMMPYIQWRKKTPTTWYYAIERVN